MSPEQVVGAVGMMGPGCDIYALGVILYQLLTGRLPFEGSVTEVLGQIIGQPPAPPSKHQPGLDPRQDAI
jgi:serine/threonine protein kinase